MPQRPQRLVRPVLVDTPSPALSPNDEDSAPINPLDYTQYPAFMLGLPPAPQPLKRMPTAPATLDDTSTSTECRSTSPTIVEGKSMLEVIADSRRHRPTTSHASSRCHGQSLPFLQPSFPGIYSVGIQQYDKSSVNDMYDNDTAINSNDDATPLLSTSTPSSPISPRFYSPFKPSLPALSATLWPKSPERLSLSDSPSVTTASYTPLKSTTRTSSLCTKILVAVAITVLLLYVVFYWVIPSIVLYFSTGSFLVQSYDFYERDHTVRRLYPQYYHTNGSLTAIANDRLSQWQCPAPVTSAANDSVNVSDIDTSTVETLHVVAHPDHWTLFPWLWDSILVNDDDSETNRQNDRQSQCNQANLVACHRCSDGDGHCQKFLSQYNLKIQLINFPLDVKLLPTITSLLIVGQHLERSIFGYLNSPSIQSLLSPKLVIGGLMLMGEECVNTGAYSPDHANYDSVRAGLSPAMKLLATTYADCRLNSRWNQLSSVDLLSSQAPARSAISVNDPIVYWPLGPSVEHGFPSTLRDVTVPTIAVRSILLNLMVTHSSGKPSRMQAQLVASQYCRSHPHYQCVIQNNDLLFKAAEKIDEFVGTNFRTMNGIAAPAGHEYLELLFDSVFTLCPSGKVPEQYRIWEALMAGSIPIVEWPRDNLTVGQLFPVHPAYGTEYRCTEYDIHRVLRQYNAPVIYIHSWRDLQAIIESFSIEQLQQKQDQLQRWLHGLTRQLRDELLWRVRYWRAASDRQSP